MDTIYKNLINWISGFSPNRYLQALVIIVIFVLAAKVVNIILTRILRKWASRTRFKFDDQFIDLVERPIFISMVLIGLSYSTRLLELPDSVAFVTLSALETIAVIVWSIFIARFLRMLLASLSGLPNRFEIVQQQTLPLFNNLTTILVIGFATYFLFLAWSINVTAWVASAGIIGIAISFAAKDTLANLFSGVFILADAPYKIGDFIVLDSGERGMVTHIGIRSTRLLTRDDVEITVPNATMGNAKINNETGGPTSKHRMRVRVSVAYGSDIDQVRDLLIDIAQTNESVCADPEPRVRFRSFGDHGLNFELLCWISEPVLRGRVLDALNSAVYKCFMKEGVEIPYPKRDVYLHTPPE